VTPVCTIAIPAYNRIDMTRRALDSALAQDLANLEIIVVDDCSTEPLWQALQSYRDERLRLFRNEKNLGLFRNFNRCLELAQGIYFRLLCCDDQLPPQSLSREVKVMDAHANVALLSTRGRRFGPDGVFLGGIAGHIRSGIYPGRDAIALALWLQSQYGYNPFNYPSGVLLRRDTAVAAGGFDTNMRVLGDVAFFLRVLEHGDLGIVDALGCDVTIHPGQVGRQMDAEGWEIRELSSLVEHYRPLLDERRLYGKVKRGVAGVAAGLSLNYRRLGMDAASSAYGKIARESGIGTLARYAGLGRLVFYRALLKAAGIRFAPIRPVSSL
jgi:glycosyltransferase involved in cell wall biosynthesis